MTCLLCSILAHGNGWIVPAIVMPIYLASLAHRRALERVEEERDQLTQSARWRFSTMEALARAIDAKDRRSNDRLRRIQFFATRLAAALGLSEQDIDGIGTAALLHDVGTLAVPGHVFVQGTPLTNLDVDPVRMHPRIGAELLSGVAFPYPVTDAVLGHHERWDGTGYPGTLKAEAIPLGARILAVVDQFTAATSDRHASGPNRYAEAAELLTRESGAALDPRLVRTFVDLLPSLLAEEADEERAIARAEGLPVDPADAPAAETPAVTRGVFANIALAHGEIYPLYEIAQSLSSNLGVADTMALISSTLSKIVPWSGCSLFVYDRRLDRLDRAFATGLEAPGLVDRAILNDGGLSEWVEGAPRTLATLDPRRLCADVSAEGSNALKSAMVCPLYFGNAFVGVFSVCHVDPDCYTDDHRRLFERICDHTATALHNSLAFEQTREEALTDPLTGLRNRRWLNRYLPQELSRAGRPPHEVALISIDVDNFKDLNDACGHEAGDRALREAATVLTSVCRSYDLCVRLGGDEFVVVLPDCSSGAADIRRDEIENRLGDVELELRPGMRVQLQASTGVAVFPRDGDTCEALLDAADRRMYSEKAKRRRPARARKNSPNLTAGSVRTPASVTPATLAAGLRHAGAVSSLSPLV
jgi:diguanylate cyclase (GGDEF)-like protein